MSASQVRSKLKRLADPKKAKLLRGFFKTGPGQYGEGDIFLGLTVPLSRKIALEHSDLPFSQIQNLLASRIHEERLIALLILVDRFKSADPSLQEKVYRFYLKNTKWINNWDLVDASAHHIVGGFLGARPLKSLIRLARSKDLWERRIAIVATFYEIRKKNLKPVFEISEILLEDKHDLIHKAVGWMLREAGKRGSEKKLEEFLRKNGKKMPRTALRYAIERFPAAKRKFYLETTLK